MKHLRYALWAMVGMTFVGLVLFGLPNKDNQPTPRTIAGFNKGAHFTLLDHTGTPYSSANIINEGDYALIYFGFTFCPVICPTELQKFSMVMDDLPPSIADKIHPIFITIDPERDTPALLNDYVPLFHPRLVGLTGTADDIKTVADQWRVYYNKVQDDTMNDYTMDHSSYVYLTDSNMNIIALFRMKNTAEDISAYIKDIMK